MLDDVITSTTKTASGMIVENGYHRNADVVWRDRKCLFPEGHYMKTTYGLDSLEVKKVGKKIQYINLHIIVHIKSSNGFGKFWKI